MLSATLFADNNFNLSTKHNTLTHCIVKTKEDKYIGLLKFKTIEDFRRICNGKMLFIYESDKCRIFTMKNMKFNVFIQDKYSKSKFLINETKEVCGKIIIESID